MGKTLDLGIRIELLPMDPHCQNISLGLYRRSCGGIPEVKVHTYSNVEQAAGRVAFIRQALIQMLGLVKSPDNPEWLRFTCRTMHERALKRAFLDLCKIETGAPLTPKPLTAFDKKADCNLTVVNLADGLYEIKCEQPTEAGAKRAAALARGFIKLFEIEAGDGGKNRIVFPCRTNHDPIIGALMYRAQNVRSAMKEEEEAATRGVLSAPSQQN